MSTYQSEAEKIKRRRAIAESLRASGNESLPASIQTGGRFDAPVSGWQYANKAVQQLLSAYMGRNADKAQDKLDTQDKQVLSELIAAKRDSMASDVNGEIDPSIQSDAGPTQVPAASKPLSKAERMQKLQAAMLRGTEFGGSAGGMAGELTERELLPPVQTPYTLNEGDVRYAGDNTPIAAAPPKQIRESPEDRVAMEFVASSVPDATPEELKAGRLTRPRSALKPGMIQYHPPTGGGGEGDLAGDEPMSDDSIRNAALDTIRDPAGIRQYATGNSKNAQRDRHKINNMVAKIMKDTGLSNNQVAQLRGRVQGELKSQKGLTDMSNSVQAYEKLAKFNGDRLLQLVDGVDTTGVPALEGAIRYVKGKGGSVDTAEFNSVLKTYQTEVARIIAQPRLVGQLTDTQIQEMQKVVDGSASAPQLRRVINRLNLEMDMRARSIEEQIKLSGGRLEIPGVDQAPAAQASPADDVALLKKWGQ